MYRKSENVVARQIAGEMLLVPIRGNLVDMQKLYVLEGSGEFIWSKIDGVASLREIRDAVVSDFDVDEARADTDVRELVAELVQLDLVREDSQYAVC